MIGTDRPRMFEFTLWVFSILDIAMWRIYCWWNVAVLAAWANYTNCQEKRYLLANQIKERKFYPIGNYIYMAKNLNLHSIEYLKSLY